MVFITDDDLKGRIKSNILADATDNDRLILNTVEQNAISTITGYAGKLYDIPFELTRTGINRKSDLISFITDHIAYDLYSRLSVTDINNNVEVRYDSVVSKLKDIQEGVYAPNWKLKDFDNDSDVAPRMYYSNTKTNHSW